MLLKLDYMIVAVRMKNGREKEKLKFEKIELSGLLNKSKVKGRTR